MKPLGLKRKEKREKNKRKRHSSQRAEKKKSSLTAGHRVATWALLFFSLKGGSATLFLKAFFFCSLTKRSRLVKSTPSGCLCHV